MSVWRRFEGHGFPSLLTTNVRNRERVFRNPASAHLLVEVIQQIQEEEGFQLIAYVVMPDHLHLVVWPGAGVSTGRIMKMIKGRFARKHQAARGVTGSFWQGRYHEKALRDDAELWAAVNYVHNNPVAAGLSVDPASYKWSSASLPLPSLSG